MAPSDEVNEATGEAPTAADQLAQRTAELAQAHRDLAAAELAGDVQLTVQREDHIAFLHRVIEKLTARAAVEAAAEAQEEATELGQQLRARYTDALEGLAPNRERARRAIEAAAVAARECTTTWAAASRLAYELDVLAMRFALAPVPRERLPDAPMMELRAAFEEAVGDNERLAIRQPLPAYGSSASDTAEQIAANKMAAAHEAVLTLGKDLKLSSDLRALFAKAGAPNLRVAPSGSTDKAFIGTTPPRASALPPGAVQSALTGVSVNQARSAEDIAERDRARRGNTRAKARGARAVAEEAQRIAHEDELIRRGKGNGGSLEGMRG